MRAARREPSGRVVTGQDAIDWDGAMQRSAEQAKALLRANAPDPKVYPVCRCGATERFGRPLPEGLVDLRGADVDLAPGQGIKRCRACSHAIHHGAMCVTRYYERTTSVRDHYHPSCVEI